MTYIWDKIFLTAVLTLFIIQRDIDPLHVAVILIAVTAACLNSYFDNRYLISAVTVMYGLIALFVPEFTVMLPVLIYDVYGRRLYAPAVLYIFDAAAAYIGGDVYEFSAFVITAAFACFLNRKSQKKELLDRQAKSIRDYEEERNLLLVRENKNLLEKQDYEIYIATLKERNRIAREIHDNVGHSLTRTILQMGALMTVYKEEPLYGQLVSVKESMDSAMNCIRESVHDLHDESIDLRHAVNDIAKNLNGRFDCRVEYDISGTVEKDYKYAIIGIVREAVSNIIRHSSNSSVLISLREHPGMYQIVIHDYTEDAHKKEDSSDLTHYMSNGGGIGLQNMYDRVSRLDGHLSVDDRFGFQVFATLPRRRERI